MFAFKANEIVLTERRTNIQTDDDCVGALYNRYIYFPMQIRKRVNGSTRLITAKMIESKTYEDTETFENDETNKRHDVTIMFILYAARHIIRYVTAFACCYQHVHHTLTHVLTCVYQSAHFGLKILFWKQNFSRVNKIICVKLIQIDKSKIN